MHIFQIMHLIKLCRKHDLDIQLIDDTLTFSENKDYLLSLIPKGQWTDRDLFLHFQPRMDQVDKEIQSQWEWYKREHFLTYYLSVRDRKG